MSETAKKFFSVDGNLPITFLIGLGVMWSTYQWGEMRDIKERLIVRETTASQYRPIIDNLIKDQNRLTTLEVELKHIRSSMDRLVIYFERQGQQAQAIK